MAITFQKDITDTDLKLAYNNNIVVFSTDSIKVLKYCEIIIGSDTLIIYANPQGEFYYNFKNYIVSEINTNNFADELNVDILTNGYLYNYSENYLETSIIFKIVFTDETFESTVKSVKWLRGLLQVEDYKSNYPITFEINTPLVLSPIDDNSNTSKYVKYFEGYPFDVSIYTGTSANLNIENISNLLDIDFVNPNKINRLVFSDGETDTSIEDVLPIDNGINELKLTSNLLSVYLTVEKESNCGGTYLKWINSLGGWSYWLFEKGSRDRGVKDLGDIQNDFYNINETISPTINIGKTSKDSIKTTSDIVSKKQMNLIKDLFDSPKVYLFKGEPFSKNTFNDWIEVSIKANNFSIQNAKLQNNEVNLVIETPDRNTMTL